MKTIIPKILIFSVLVLHVISYDLSQLQDFSTLEFPPNHAVSITNPLLWTVHVSCSVQSSDASDVLVGKVDRGSATINGQNVTTGTEVEVQNGGNLVITASKLGKFEITNLGQNTVVTHCGLSNNLKFLEY